MALVFYECCSVADDQTRDDYTSALRFPCWNCGEEKQGQWHWNLEDYHPLRTFLVTGRQIRPTDATPPWEI